MKEQNQQKQSQSAELLDLAPDEEQRTLIKRILTPKVIILTFLSLIFVSKNIYYNFVVAPPKSTEPPPEIKQDQSVMERLYGYVILTVVLTVLYFFMIYLNNRQFEKEQKAKQQKKNQQEKATEEPVSEEKTEKSSDLTQTKIKSQ